MIRCNRAGRAFGYGLWLGLTGLGVSPSFSQDRSAVPVTTVVAKRVNVPIVLSGIGTVRAAQSVTVKTRIDGQLDKVAFSEGQDVAAGQVLAQIDPRPYQAALDQAVAQKAHDEASLASAVRDLDRYVTLGAQNSIAQQALDSQRSTVDQLKASLQSDQAQIDNARVQLGYATIRAPVSGRTGLRLIDAGNIVHATDTGGLVVINQIDPIAVVFTLPESSFQQLNRALQGAGKQSLVVTASGRDNNDALGTGHLVLIDNQIDSTTGTFQLKALFTNSAHSLWPGQYVTARVTVGTVHDAVTVPASAVQRSNSGLQLYVVKPDDTVDVQDVQVGQIQDGVAIIERGIPADTRVIIDGQFKVKPGVKVREAGGADRAASTPARTTS